MALLVVRAISAISFDRPILAVTSGAEEEAVMSLIRAIHGEPYSDPHRIPFSASYYNWLFYAFFGGSTRIVLSAFDLSTAWVPTVGRLLALTGALTTWVLAYATIRQVATRDRAAQIHNGLIATFVAFGPLVGFWALSINPDLWANACTIGSALALMALYRRHIVTAVALASILSIAAWSFKQSYLFPAVTLGLFLLVNRDWKGIAVAAGIHAAGFFGPLMFGSDEYRQMLFAGLSDDFAFSRFLHNIANVASKTVPVACGVILAACQFPRRRELVSDIPLLVSSLGIMATLVNLPMSAKTGAGENYYFPLVFHMSVLSAWAVVRLAEHGWPRIATAALTLAWVAQGIACLLVLAGMVGVSTVAPLDRRYTMQRPCVADLPSPMYAADPYLSLPWMHAAGPHFVLAYAYNIDRRRGIVFEGGGVKGLIEKGWFASIVLPSGTLPTVDGAQLEDSYARVKSNCAGLDVWLRQHN